ncbi:MAG: 8-oxo-dGTP diphosphatase MutT [Proteobacteria bacterium]|nr:8-oxo-dGTP diphosphatase MutT [Pseudomonadota bacterium]
MKNTLEVVVGLVFNANQEILLAWRGPEKSPGNCWEFPGGKIEQGETQYQAICRELKEEINLEVLKAQPGNAVLHQYETKKVILYPWWIEKYAGNLYGAEGQKIIWVNVKQLKDFPLPAANYALLDLLPVPLLR